MEPYFLLFFFFIAFLYSSVGHGGASGYLALMAIIGISPSLMKPTALLMNVVVSLISFIGFYRAGYFRLNLFLPFAISSIPMAFMGGNRVLPEPIYKKILAICLIISIVRLLFQINPNTPKNKPISIGVGLVLGAMIGLISGMIGIGGGILLSPLILLMGWATIKETAAVSALFIFVNSLSALLGFYQNNNIQLTNNLEYAVLVTILGGILGSYFGSKKFNSPTLKYFLAFGLLIASMKLLFA
jgi:uncharacterized protein